MSVEPFEEAFEALYARSYRLALRLTGSPAEAEDVASEALARAYLAWRRLRSPDHRVAWVLRVTTNLAVDAHRWRSRPPLARPAAAEGGPSDLRIVLADALRRLPERQRQVVVLRYLVDLFEAEVSRALRISPGSVKQHLHRALASLRRTLPPDSLTEVPAWP
jgi:RNA polymerase sigma-70 factor (ECF subfamily)